MVSDRNLGENYSLCIFSAFFHLHQNKVPCRLTTQSHIKHSQPCFTSKYLRNNLKTVCKKSKSICNTSKTSCKASKTPCHTSKSSCNSSKSLCNTSKSLCKSSKTTCNTSKTSCNTPKTPCNFPKAHRNKSNLQCKTQTNRIHPGLSIASNSLQLILLLFR